MVLMKVLTCRSRFAHSEALRGGVISDQVRTELVTKSLK